MHILSFAVFVCILRLFATAHASSAYFAVELERPRFLLLLKPSVYARGILGQSQVLAGLRPVVPSEYDLWLFDRPTLLPPSTSS